jgi:hypothetical protein
MIELDPRDRLSYADQRKAPVFAMIVGAIAILGCGSFFYWQYVAQRSNHVEIYRQLGISPLPVTVELLPQVQSRLDQLSREPCYRAAIYALADALLEAGYPRETDASLLSFAKRCGESDEILIRRYQALFQASNVSAALRVAEDLVKSDPADAQVRSCEGFRMPAAPDSAAGSGGRRPKASRGGNRDGGTCGGAAGSMGII